jgi:hypothetical protein
MRHRIWGGGITHISIRPWTTGGDRSARTALRWREGLTAAYNDRMLPAPVCGCYGHQNASEPILFHLGEYEAKGVASAGPRNAGYLHKWGRWRCVCHFWRGRLCAGCSARNCDGVGWGGGELLRDPLHAARLRRVPWEEALKGFRRGGNGRGSDKRRRRAAGGADVLPVSMTVLNGRQKLSVSASASRYDDGEHTPWNRDCFLNITTKRPDF